RGDVARVGLGDPEEVEDQARRVRRRRLEVAQSIGDPLPHHLGRVPVADPEVAAYQLAHREQGNGRPVRRAMGLVDRDAARAAPVDELEADSALPYPGFSHHAHHLSIRLERAAEDAVEPGELLLAPDQTRETLRARRVEAGAQRTDPEELEDTDGRADP